MRNKSYEIAALLAKKKKPHAAAEEIIAPALKIAAQCMLTTEAVELFKQIPLSSKTIARRIQDMSEDIKSQLTECVDSCEEDETSGLWAIQIDESTDISRKAQLLSFLKIIRDGKIVNEYFFCSELEQTTTGEDIFKLVDRKVRDVGLKWDKCISVCTDGAPSMQGRKKGFVAYVLQMNPMVRIVHCMIHREVLVSKALPNELSVVLNEVVKVVNYIKKSPLRSRIFAALCDAMESDYKCLLYHTKVRWLSKGKVLNRFVHLKVEIISFIETEEIDFSFLKNKIWWLQVSFLGDLFEKLNGVNLSLQGANENLITITGKLKSFGEKLAVWGSKVSSSKFECFPSVDANLLKFRIKNQMKETLKMMLESFQTYFPSLDTSEIEWIINPFGRHEETNLEPAEEENLIDLRNDVVRKGTFTNNELSQFWILLKDEYPSLSKKAIKSLLPFGSSYLCEHGFSALTEMKSKKRERLQMIDEEMRVCLSTIAPRITTICAQKQSHSSH